MAGQYGRARDIRARSGPREGARGSWWRPWSSVGGAMPGGGESTGAMKCSAAGRGGRAGLDCRSRRVVSLTDTSGTKELFRADAHESRVHLKLQFLRV